MEDNDYWIDVTTTYKVYSVGSEEEARTLVEQYEDGDPVALSKVSVKDQSVQIEKGL
jgi:hypothetical protein